MKKESHIDGIRLYSDKLDSDNSKASKTFQSYKKVEKTTTTKTVVKSGSNPAQTTVTKKKKTLKKNLGIPRKSIHEITGSVQEMLAATQGEKEKYVYSGKLKEKTNYLYYVSGIGYVTKEGVPVKDNKPKEIKEIKAKPKPTRVVGERVTIVIQNKKPERKKGELVENFQYHESKDLGKNSRQSIVIHRWKGDPFYQSVDGKRSSSYTYGAKSRVIIEKTDFQSKTIETKTTTQKNQYQNTTTKVAQSGTGSGNKKYNESSYQRTINVEERKRNILPKARFEKTYTETNRRTISAEPKKYVPPQKKYQEKTPESYKRNIQTQKAVDTQKYQRNIDQNKYQQKTPESYKRNPQTQKAVDTQKYQRNIDQNKYQQKTAESYKRNTQPQRAVDTQKYQRNIDQNKYQQKTAESYKRNTQPQRDVDTQKYQRNIDQNKYQQKTAESYKRNTQPQRDVDTQKYQRNIDQNKYQQKTEETQNTRISQEQNMLSDPNYCPIHGYHGQVQSQLQSNNEDIDNYKFYESKVVSKTVGNVNTNINTNINSQRAVKTEENINYNAAYINAMNQDQMAQAEEGYDLSKVYIATKITPVYSEMLDQQFQSHAHTHVCKVCGNPFDDNQMDMMQQNQISSMQEMEYDINCPIHGQNATQ